MKRALFCILMICSGVAFGQDKTPAPAKDAAANLSDLQNLVGASKGDKNEPTYISSNSLTLKSQDRVFQYTGNVQVKHGDMTLTADTLDGRYTDKNEIDQLTARKNVVITKADKMHAKCEKAIYDARSKVITLTENPELEQEGNTLMADAIKIFLEENRSVAEGQVRVKVTGAKGLDAAAQQKK